MQTGSSGVMQASEVGGTIVEDRVEAGVGDVMQGCGELGGRTVAAAPAQDQSLHTSKNNLTISRYQESMGD